MELGPLQTKWIESLEAHPERQLHGQLGRMNNDGTYRACCLGEAGLIAGVCGWIGNELSVLVNGEPTNMTTILSGNSYQALGLIGPNGEDVLNYSKNHLSYLNDNGKTWPEIAAILRANPEYYFTESK